jgi:hypothetical protein
VKRVGEALTQMNSILGDDRSRVDAQSNLVSSRLEIGDEEKPEYDRNS